MTRARMAAAKVTPQTRAARVETAKVAPRIGLSPKCDHRILLILTFSACRGGTSKNSDVDRAVAKFWQLRGWKN